MPLVQSISPTKLFYPNFPCSEQKFPFPFPLNFPRTAGNFSLTTTTHRHRSCQKRQYLSSQSVRPSVPPSLPPSPSLTAAPAVAATEKGRFGLSVHLRQTVSLTARPLTPSLTCFARSGRPRWQRKSERPTVWPFAGWSVRGGGARSLARCRPDGRGWQERKEAI